MNRILFAWVLCALAWPVLADDDARANRLMVEAVSLIQASEREPSAAGKFRFLKEAHDNLVEIVDQHPSSDLAVRLATGQAVGSVSLSGVREAMERARIAEPAKPGAPIHVWRWILAGFADGTALLGNARTGRTIHQWKHPGSGGGGVTSASFSPDGARVLTGAANRRAVLHDIATGRMVHEWKTGARVKAVAYSGRWVLTGDDDYEVELHDARTGRTLRKWRYRAPPTAVAFSPDDRGALMGFSDGTVILCDIRLREGRRGYERTSLTPDGGCW